MTTPRPTPILTSAANGLPPARCASARVSCLTAVSLALVSTGDAMDELDSVVPFVRIHAEAEAPRECCGVVVREASKDALTYVACSNIAQRTPEQNFEHFVIAPQDYARAEDTGEVIAIAHSHVFADPLPTPADRTGIERTQLPWLIVN